MRNLPHPDILMNNICELWAQKPRVPLGFMAASLGCSKQTIMRYLRLARQATPPDPRAARRLEYPSRQMGIMSSMLRKADLADIKIEDIRDAFWPIGPIPQNWRIVISVVTSRIKTAQASNIKNDDSISSDIFQKNLPQ